MIAIKDAEMPTTCDWCIIRTRCDWYTAWYHGVRHVSPPKPEGDECRLIDLSKYEDDLR